MSGIFLAFDTETNGLLPKKITIEPKNLHIFPHTVQLSYALYNTTNDKLIKMRDFIIQIPSNIIISEECSKIHGITNEISQTRGVNIMDAIDEFIQDFNGSNMIIAHNMAFDSTLIEVEILRIIDNKTVSASKKKYYTEFIHTLKTNKNLYCTMQESIDMCNIKAYYKDGREYVKYPKLAELHEHLFQSVPKNLHNSMNDVIVCLRCFYKMIFDIDVLTVNTELDILYSNLLK
jgi:DNA polymerase III epsilon subunit-like protein